MKIVVVDSIQLSDEQKARLLKIGPVRTYLDLPQSTDELIARTADHETDHIDMAATKSRSITVTNVPGYAVTAVSEHTFALMLALSRNVIPAEKSVRQGQYSWGPFQGDELRGKTLGLLGFGPIGKNVARIAQGFGMKVLVWTRNPDPKRTEGLNITFEKLEDVLKQSDILSLHLPLTADTRGLLGKEKIALIKQGAKIINTARGALVDENALAQALQEGRLSGAALDVFEQEPPSPKNPLLALDNVIVTPHIGFFTEEAVKTKIETAVANVEKWAQTSLLLSAKSHY